MARTSSIPSGIDNENVVKDSTFLRVQHSSQVHTTLPVTQSSYLTTNLQPTDSLTSDIALTDSLTPYIPVDYNIDRPLLTISPIILSPTRFVAFSELSESEGQRSTSVKVTPWLSFSEDASGKTKLLATHPPSSDDVISRPAGSTKLNVQSAQQTRQAGLEAEGATTGPRLNLTASTASSGYRASNGATSSWATFNKTDQASITLVDAQQTGETTHLLQYTKTRLSSTDLDLKDPDRVSPTISPTQFSSEVGDKNSWHDFSLTSVTPPNTRGHFTLVDLKDDPRHPVFGGHSGSDIPSSSAPSPTANVSRLSKHSDAITPSVVKDLQSVQCKNSSSKLEDCRRISPTSENTIDASQLLPQSVTPTVTQLNGLPDSVSNLLQASFSPASVTLIDSSMIDSSLIESSPRQRQTKPVAAPPMNGPTSNTTDMTTQVGPSRQQPLADDTTSTAQTTLGLASSHGGQSSSGTSSISLTTIVTTSPLSTTAITVTTSASTETTVIVVAACAVFALLLIVLIAIFCVRRSRKTKTKVQHEGDELWVDMNHIHSMPLPSLTSTNELTLNLKSGTDTYTVFRPFTALDGGQITLKEGDILQIDERQDEWWKGLNLNTGQTGWFPCDFVRPLGGSKENILWDNTLKSPVERSAATAHPLAAQRQVSSFQIKKNVATEMSRNHELTLQELEDNQEEQYVESWVKMAASVSMSSLPTTERSYTNASDYNAAVKADGKTYRAVYAYKPVCKGEMGLKEGEVVICKEKDRNGWMFGTKPRSKEEGWFPAVYVDEISTDSESCCSDIPDTYEILDSNKLHKADRSWIGIEHKVLYDYASSIPGDLALEQYDVVIVLQTLANGWWFGLNGNNYGWFPGSYVEMIEEDETEIPALSPQQVGFNDLSGKNIQESPSDDKTKAIDQITYSTKSPPVDTPNTTSEIITPNEKKSEHNFRPNRKAPHAPGPDLPPLKPARPAPAPPVRQHSQLRKGSMLSDSYQMSKPDGKVTPLTKQDPAFQGRRPKITKVARGSISEKQLNPIIRPSTRGFVPRPSQVNHFNRNDQFNGKLAENAQTVDFHLHEITLKDVERLNNGRSSFSSHGSFSPSPSHLSHVHGSDPDYDHASNFSHERSQTPDARIERSNSPIIPTSGQFLHNVQRFNRFVRHTSPTLSESSDCITKFTKANVKEHNAQPGNDRLWSHKTVAQQHKKIPPPVLPHSKLSYRLKKGIRSPTEIKVESNDPSETNQEKKKETISTGIVSSSEDVITSDVHDVIPITPGKVSEIVQQINKLTPLQQTLLNRTDSDSDTITNID